MSQPLRLIKKRVLIDPSELDDLIFNSAVGNGVGAGFLEALPEPLPSLAISVIAEAAMVPGEPASSLDGEPASRLYLGTQNVANDKVIGPESRLDDGPTSRGYAGPSSSPDADPTSRLDVEPGSSLDGKPTYRGDVESSSSPDSGPTSSLDSGSESTLDVDPASRVDAGFKGLWISEIGTVFPAKRVQRIALAQDCLTAQEKDVYKFLWGPEPPKGEPYRVVSVGYKKIHDVTAISVTNVKFVTKRLISKSFLSVQSEGFASQPTTYRANSYLTVLKLLRSQGRTNIVKSGNGVLFVKPIGLDVDPTSSLDAASPSRLDIGPSSSGYPASTPGLDAGASSSVDAGLAPLRECSGKLRIPERKESLPPSSSISSELLEHVIRAAKPTTIDTKLATLALSEVGPLKLHEAAYMSRLAAVKVTSVKNATSPTGLWKTQFVNYATGATLQDYRESCRIERQKRLDHEFGTEGWQAVLTNPNVDEDQRHMAQRILDI